MVGTTNLANPKVQALSNHLIQGIPEANTDSQVVLGVPNVHVDMLLL